MMFDLHIGIDYSGAQTPISRLAGLQVAAAGSAAPELMKSPAAVKSHCNWTRREIAEWLVGTARSGERFIAGLDHAFSFPVDYFNRYALSSWLAFLDDFCQHWPTDDDHTYVDFIRDAQPGPPTRTGDPKELRLTETWTSSAKSVFKFDVQGSVAKSTHAGLPWLRRIRAEVGDAVHVWPFDGWQIPEGKSVIAEVYPSIFRHRYPPQKHHTADQHDALAIARWLTETDRAGCLGRYFDPPLTEDERRTADLEGWILGIT